MKKITIFLLLAVMLGSLVGCGKKEPMMGLGVVSERESTLSADGEMLGEGKLVTTAAAVVLEGDKIVSCRLDCAEITLPFDENGKAGSVADLRTKGEQKESYGMVEYGGAGKEWYEQAEAFSALVVGKKVKHLEELVGDKGKGTGAVLSAGCTIVVSDFVKAIKAAAEQARPVQNARADSLKLTFETVQSEKTDATEDKRGTSAIAQTVTALLQGEKEYSQSVQITGSVTFDEEGVTADAPTELMQKRTEK